jgi:hypothetical protein
VSIHSVEEERRLKYDVAGNHDNILRRQPDAEDIGALIAYKMADKDA